MVTQFKCYKCGSMVENIPYCGGCEIALPNCCKVNGYKCSDCGKYEHCAYDKFPLKLIIKKRQVYPYPLRQKIKTKRYAIYKRDGDRCLKCGSADRLTLDHIVPKCKGGSNHPNNLQTLCSKCNHEKGVDIVDYRKNKIMVA